MRKAGINSIACLDAKAHYVFEPSAIASEVFMATPTWATLYQEALHSEPEDLLDRMGNAAQSIVDRMHKIGGAASRLHRSEFRALCLALSDLHILRISHSHREWHAAQFLVEPS